MKKRDKILIGVIAILIAWIIILNFLSVGNGNWNEKQIQKINFENNSDKFCFAVLSDNQNGLLTFQKIYADIQNKNPTFAIDNGDIVENGDKEAYRFFYDEIRNSQVPFLVNIGNHDIRENGRTHYFNTFGNFYYSFSYNNSLFILLDDANQKNIDSQQMTFLENELKKNYTNKFVFMHVPPFTPTGYVPVIPKIIKDSVNFEYSLTGEESKQFTDLMEKYNDTIVFSGHLHGYFNETKNNILYITTGSSGGALLSSDPSHYFFDYTNVCVNGSSVSYEVRKFPSPSVNLIPRLGYMVWLYLWYAVVINRFVIILVVMLLFFTLDIVYQKLKKLHKSFKKRFSLPRKHL